MNYHAGLQESRLKGIAHEAIVCIGKLNYCTLGNHLARHSKPAYPEHQNSVATPKRLAYLTSADPLASSSWDGKLASTEVDYLADNGAKLDSAIKANSIGHARLQDALQLLIRVEGESKTLIDKILLLG
ncbi:hypothetical protein BDW68DRAFT_179174 [Aspergillus falconensis]